MQHVSTKALLEQIAAARRGRHRPLHDTTAEPPVDPFEERGGYGDLALILSRAKVGILHRDLEGRLLVVNDAFCELVGRSADELYGLTFPGFTHEDDVDWSVARYLEQLAKAEPFEVEKRYLRPDGSFVWCSVHVSFVLDGNGRPQSAIVVASDITARRKAQDELRESERHYRYTVEFNPQISWIAAPDGSVLEVSSRWFEVTGIPQQEALGQRWVAALHPDDKVKTLNCWMVALGKKHALDVEYRLLTGDGTYRWFRSRATARLDEAGEVVRWYGTLEDVHDRRVAIDELTGSEERFRLAAQAANLGIWDYDAMRDQRAWSDEFKAMLGLPADTVPDVATALALVVPEDRPALEALVEAARAGKSDARFEVTLRILRADDGRERCMRTAGWCIHAASGRLTRILVTVQDITEERTAAERIRWTATHDALTRIPNRALFTERLDQAIRTAGRSTKIALILLDVDRLKEVNDTIGHDAGDLVLKTFAERLRGAFGPDTMIGRLGGDEFAVLIDHVDPAALPDRLVHILDGFREPIGLDGQVCDTQATAGLSIYPDDGRNATDLLKSADIALYEGKAGRRGELSRFQPDMRANIQRRTSMINIARDAERERRIAPFYQPKVDLKTGRTVGFEALLRWRHHMHGIQGPDTIAAAFDDFRLAALLSSHMIEAVASDVRGWLDRGFDPGRVAINLAPAEFRRDDLVERVLEPLRRYAVPLDRIDLEITETVLLGRDPDKIAKTLSTFHDHGMKIALDDFGTGFASLTHLKMFPVDVIKIDKSFIAKVCDQPEDAAIVEAIIGLGHRLRMEVIAEGVEQEEQARYLASHGCDVGQGYLFGRAVPADEVTATLAAT